MKKHAFIYILVLSVIFACTDNSANEAIVDSVDTDTQSLKSGSFTFPEVDWGIYETHQQKIDACQIPESILKQLSTSELLHICMEYPFLMDAYAFNTPLEGIRAVVSRFNGFVEFMKRPDNCIHLFNYLKETDIRDAQLSQLNNIQIGEKTLKYAFAELLLSSDDIIKNARADQLKEISGFALNMFESKYADRSYQGLSTISASAFLFSSIKSKPLSVRTADNSLNSFLATGIIQNEEQLREIRNYANSIKTN